MKIIKRLRAFTVIELLIVLTIIGVLSGITIVSYNGVQQISRDNKRKGDLQAIATAYKMHYQDKKTWSFSSAELGGLANCEGFNLVGNYQCGARWFNFTGTNYVVSMADALVQNKYMTQAPLDPSLKLPTEGISGTGAKQYMKFYCYESSKITGIVVFAHLENKNSVTTPFSDEKSAKASEFASCTVEPNSTSLQATAVGYGMNFAVVIK